MSLDRSAAIALFAVTGALASTAAQAWDPTLPQHPTTYVVDDSLTDGPVANFREMYADPYTLKDTLKPTRTFTPPKVRPKVLIARDRFVISDKILFETGSAVVKPASRELLDTIAAALNAHPTVTKVTVEGHTDDVGDDDFNLQLSQARAAAVLAKLVDRGVAEERLEAMGKGESDPRVKAVTDEARTANRRVEFIIAERAAPDPADSEAQVAAVEDAATVRARLREERLRLTKLPTSGDLPVRNESTSYADVTIGGVSVGRLGPLKSGIIRDVPAGFYSIELKLQNGYVRSVEARTEVVRRPAIPGNEDARETLDAGEVYSWHDDPSKGHVPQKSAAMGPIQRKLKRIQGADAAGEAPTD